MDPDERPSFEEVLDFLEKVHLPEELGEDGCEVGAAVMRRLSSATSQQDLRSSVSEPILRMNDDFEEDIDGLKTCGDEDIGRTQIVVRALRLDSVGSSNGSSLGSVVDETYGCGSLDAVKDSDECEYSRRDVATFSHEGVNEHLDSPCVITSVKLCQEDTDGSKGGSVINNNPGSARTDSVGHRMSLSTNNSASELQLSQGCLEPCGREKHSSMQTLLAEEGVMDGGNEPAISHRGGGDSGIDPGEMDIFKYPQQQRHQLQVSTASCNFTDRSSNSGDHTPVCCTSPEPNPNICNSRNAATPSARHDLQKRDSAAKGISVTPVISPSCSIPNLRESAENNGCGGPAEESKFIDPITNSSPTHSSFSHSRTSSIDASQLDTSLLIGERSQSPFTQSWASSEFSFILPSPSTSWAPPSSPALPHNRHSLPSSPPHRHSPYNTFRRHHSPLQSRPPHRYSQDVTASQPLRLRKVSSSSRRPKSCRNSALFSVTSGGDKSNTVSELQMDFERMMKLAKTVHFVNEEDSIAAMDFPRESVARQRSRSSPSRRRKTSATLPEDRRNIISLREYGISLKTDLIDFDASCSSKYYKITPASNTRLSSSTPDLSKLSLHSSSC